MNGDKFSIGVSENLDKYLDGNNVIDSIVELSHMIEFKQKVDADKKVG